MHTNRVTNKKQASKIGRVQPIILWKMDYFLDNTMKKEWKVEIYKPTIVACSRDDEHNQK